MCSEIIPDFQSKEYSSLFSAYEVKLLQIQNGYLSG